MSWTAWHATAPPPLPGLVAATSVIPTAVNPAPTLLPAQTPISAGMQYTPEQWAQMQQHNWQQWAQWQQQYQQWHQQYGAEYQKTMNALTAPAPNTSVPPPLPTENKPPPPPPPDDGYGQYGHTGYSTIPQQRPPNQPNNDLQNASNKRPIETEEYEVSKRQMTSQSQKALNLEELTEAEKKFDKEFAAWEAQFNKWKEQNANHPDKTQYLEYEKKWESWRNSLLDRREQMRKKRIALQGSMPTKPQLPDLFSKPPPTQNNEPLSFKNDNDFLKGASPSEGGIPGLDLVQENDNVEKTSDATSNSNHSKGPDLDAISKGINSILGDAKLLNMLSMVSQTQPGTPVDSQPKITPKNNASIPSLLNIPLQRPNYPEPYHSETVNNFDDQTRMSFSNGPNECEVNYMNNSQGNNFRRYSRNDRFNQPESHEKCDSNSQFNEDQWNEEDEYDKYHEFFNDAEQNHQVPHDFPVKDEPKADDQPLFVPELVVDYEHKSLKIAEPEISLDMVRTFDYRHKPVNRIPYPSRPVWLSSTLRNIKQFDPLGTGRFGSNEPGRFGNNESGRFGNNEPGRFGNNEPGRFGNNEPGRFGNNEPGRFGNNEPGRFGSNEPGRFGNNDTLFDRDASNDKHRFSAGVHSETTSSRDKERSRYDLSPKNYRESNHRSTNKSRFEKKMELEDLSDDEWNDDKSFSKNNEQNISRGNINLDDLIFPPGRQDRPLRIVIILRGPPGSGKTYLAKLIKDKEVENGGSAPRILSLDDYFMVEEEKETVEDGKPVKIKEMTYEYEAEMEESYRLSLTKAFKKTINDGYFHFVIVDNVNQRVKDFGELWSYAKQNGFQVYICQLDLDPELCTRRNIHHRSESYIEDCVAGWEPTPDHHPLVDPTSFLQNAAAITEVEMEEAEQFEENEETGEEHVRSKWDTFDCSLNNLARLDGVSKPLRAAGTMEEYLKMDEDPEQYSKPTKSGQKRVRWADLEEQKHQKKLKAMGFVIGQSNWNQPTNGETALTQTRYIERRFK